MGRRKFTLYKICLGRVYRLLKKGTWKHYSVNPFSNLPSSIVDDLMARTQYDNVSISAVYPLLTSGSLTSLLLSVYQLQKERELFLEVLQTNCLKFLRSLGWNSANDGSSTPLIETLIRSCPKLESFITCQFFNLNVFQNCKELKNLRIYDQDRMRDYKLSPEELSTLASLRNLQEVIFSESMDSGMMADILKHCPQLISLGCNDSLKGLEKVHADLPRKCEADCTEVSEQFKLKKCVWGQDTEKLDSLATDDAILYKSSFPEKVRIAVSLCPFVEHLRIYISHRDAIASLKNLKRLSYLRLIFLECAGDYTANFIELLKVIGPNLKYLGVNTKQPVPVDLVCECCTHLDNFEISVLASASAPVRPHYNVSLKKLCIMEIDGNALLFLLAGCKGLVELTIFDALCLNDDLLDQILRQNPLAQLKICDIAECSLSKRGFRMFLEKTVSLERVKFASFRRNIAAVVENLIKEMNRTNVIYGERYDIPGPEFGAHF